jgi:putative OPT family oligopeptide transporter
MSAPTQNHEGAEQVTQAGPAEHKPYVPDEAVMPEFTWGPLLVGTLLGIVFGASSLYLLLKVGMTVSASVPIAVLSITLFRAFSKWFGIRRATILENNVVQTAGSAGESLAFGVGVTMPALLLLGFEMHWVNVLTVAVLGGVLGVLLMIPLRRAFIVKQHGKLKYPEGTACAEVLIAGERGGASARMVFVGFGIAFVHKILNSAAKLWPESPAQNLYTTSGGKKVGLKGAAIGGELSPEMMGVGYLIGPRIACLMMAGAVLSYFVLGPMIATFGEGLDKPVPPATSSINKKTGEDEGLIRNMPPKKISEYYLKYIGAGAVAAAGIISMLRVMPLILASIVSGMRDLRASGGANGGNGTNGGPATPRTERDLSMRVVLFGSIALVAILAAVPQLGLGLSVEGILGAIMILVFGFLFVTVSSRLTGEVGSSSNPISGMTIATLLLTCLVFVLIGKTSKNDPTVMLTALSVAAVVCIASSNGGTTSQDLKTGYLVGATPKYQQYAILIGALTSAVVIGGTLLLLNSLGTHYVKVSKEVHAVRLEVPSDAPREKPGKPYDKGDLLDENEYAVVHVTDSDKYPGVKEGRYLVDDDGHPVYKTDIPIKRENEKMDDGADAPKAFDPPQPALFALIIKGILGGKLEWGLVILGVLIAVMLELAGVSSLPVAVGMYLGLGPAVPAFIGGTIRWITDRWRGVSASEAESETSPGVLLSSGYIAGGTLCGLIIGFFAILPDSFNNAINLGQHFGFSAEGKVADATKDFLESPTAKLLAVGMFFVLAAILLVIGSKKESLVEGGPAPPDPEAGGEEYPRHATGDERPAD